MEAPDARERSAGVPPAGSAASSPPRHQRMFGVWRVGVGDDAGPAGEDASAPSLHRCSSQYPSPPYNPIAASSGRGIGERSASSVAASTSRRTRDWVDSNLAAGGEPASVS